MRSFLKNLAAFLCGLAALSLSLHVCLPLPDVPQVKPKLQWLAEHPEDYDTVVIGSSRVRRGFSPSTFDAAMKGHGFPTRTYNLGVDAMTIPELSFVLDQVSASPHPALRRVIIELNPVRWNLPEMEGGTLREVYWHNARYTALACEAAFRDPRDPPPWSVKLPIMAQHLSLMLANYLNLGRQSDVATLVHSQVAAKKPPEMRGTSFFPVEKALNKAEAVQLAQKLENFGPWEQRPPLEGPIFLKEVARIATTVRGMGCEPIFIVAPTLYNWRYNGPGSQLAENLIVFEFDDPKRFPQPLLTRTPL